MVQKMILISMDEKGYESLKIENIVASGGVADSIDLENLSDKIKNCELNTKRFPGAVYRIEKPKMASLIFSSGKVVLTGIRKKEDLHEGLTIIMDLPRAAGRDHEHRLFVRPRQVHQPEQGRHHAQPRAHRVRARTVPGACLPDRGPEDCRPSLQFR